MKTMSEPIPDLRHFWIAIRFAPYTTPEIFGPFTAEEAMAKRAAWTKLHLPPIRVSAAYIAAGADEALLHAHDALPRN